MKEWKGNLLVCGLLSTGSSALIDMFREYSNLNVILHEFDDFRAPGLVADQLNAIQKLNFANNIKKLTEFKSKVKLVYNYMFPILTLRIRSIQKIRNQFAHLARRIKELNLLKKLEGKLSSNISYEQKIKYANNWIIDVGKLNNKNCLITVFNQPIISSLNVSLWSEVFNPWKLVCVIRNPKDQLAEIIKKDFLFAPYGGPKMNHGGVLLETLFGRGRESAISFHIEAIKKRYDWIETLKKEIEPDRFLLIDFEGLVNNYYEYKSIIENFIGNTSHFHKKPKLFFNPENTKKNIDIYKRYLLDKEIDALKDLEIRFNDMINII